MLEVQLTRPTAGQRRARLEARLVEEVNKAASSALLAGSDPLCAALLGRAALSDLRRHSHDRLRTSPSAAAGAVVAMQAAGSDSARRDGHPLLEEDSIKSGMLHATRVVLDRAREHGRQGRLTYRELLSLPATFADALPVLRGIWPSRLLFARRANKTALALTRQPP